MLATLVSMQLNLLYIDSIVKSRVVFAIADNVKACSLTYHLIEFSSLLHHPVSFGLALLSNVLYLTYVFDMHFICFLNRLRNTA